MIRLILTVIFKIRNCNDLDLFHISGCKKFVMDGNKKTDFVMNFLVTILEKGSPYGDMNSSFFFFFKSKTFLGINR